ncbi:MAG: TetR/AcrR family transcriptional regulator [Clostridia bacterium]|nr:TetR/AcrR family transcriptional regulator [Clostridia bacterium]
MAEIKDALITDEISEEILHVAEEIARKDGARNVTVRSILSKMGVTNRVFYNRFHNIEEVLELIYTRAVSKMQESIQSEYDVRTNFFEYVMDVVVKVLINTYDVKSQFSQYMFEFDSLKETNRIWWTDKIREIIEAGKATGQIKDVDSDMLSYMMWTFLRGYNADAVNRKLSKEEAVANVKFGMNCLFDGIRNT